MSLAWAHRHLAKALALAYDSKDPNTKVGAKIVGPDNEPISDGYNGFPRGIEDTWSRLMDREMKNRLMVHAEMNAVLNAVRLGHRTKGGILYFVAFDPQTRKVWGGPPCTRCTLELIQAGIVKIVTYPYKAGPSNWKDDVLFAKGLLDEAKIVYREITPVHRVLP